MGTSVKSVPQAGEIRTRFEALKFLAISFCRVLFLPSAHRIACVCNVATFKPPKKEGESVQMTGVGILLGPSPALSAIMGGINESFVKEVILPSMTADAGAGLLNALSKVTGRSDEVKDRPIVH